MANQVDNSEDVIDSRDVIARIEELESDISSWNDDIDEANEEIGDKESEVETLESEVLDLDEEDDADAIAELENNIDALRSDIDELENHISSIHSDIVEAEQELAPIKALAEEAEDYAPDWKYGETLIRESYFTKYAKQLVQDIGGLPQELPAYIENNINWEGVADDLLADYTSVDFDGVEYYIR